jgi:hypothetical protein
MMNIRVGRHFVAAINLSSVQQETLYFYLHVCMSVYMSVCLTIHSKGLIFWVHRDLGKVWLFYRHRLRIYILACFCTSNPLLYNFIISFKLLVFTEHSSSINMHAVKIMNWKLLRKLFFTTENPIYNEVFILDIQGV